MHTRSVAALRIATVAGLAGLAAAAAGACGPRAPRQFELRLYNDHYAFNVVADPTPPYAREPILYKIVIRDRDSRQPIDGGEGQIYASNEERASTWDGLTRGPEIGTYYGKLRYVTSGLWAVAIRFRRDSLHPLEKVEWMQEVFNERRAAVP